MINIKAKLGWTVYFLFCALPLLYFPYIVYQDYKCESTVSPGYYTRTSKQDDPFMKPHVTHYKVLEIRQKWLRYRYITDGKVSITDQTESLNNWCSFSISKNLVKKRDKLQP